MPATIIGLSQGYSFEPTIIEVTGKDGITAFSFNVIGTYSSVASLYRIGEPVFGVPGQPSGSFKSVNTSIEHVAGGQTGIYRLSVSAEGGSQNEANITESSFTYASSDENGVRPADQARVIYRLEWLYPSVTVTTNSQSQDAKKAEGLAKNIVGGLAAQIIQDRPSGIVNGRRIDKDKIVITGSSVENAGGLYRVRATASRGLTPIF